LAKEKGWTRERRELSAAWKKKAPDEKGLRSQALENARRSWKRIRARLLAMQQRVQAATMRLLGLSTPKPREEK